VILKLLLSVQKLPRAQLAVIFSLEIILPLELADLGEGEAGLEFFLGGPEGKLVDLVDVVRLRREAVLNSL
jgi:hypothetical protein